MLGTTKIATKSYWRYKIVASYKKLQICSADMYQATKITKIDTRSYKITDLGCSLYGFRLEITYLPCRNMIKLGTVKAIRFDDYLLIALSGKWEKMFDRMPEFEVKLDSKGRIHIISTMHVKKKPE